MHLAGQGKIRRKPMFGSDARVDNEYRLNIRSLSTSNYKAMLLLLVSGAVLAVVGGGDVKSAELHNLLRARCFCSCAEKGHKDSLCPRSSCWGTTQPQDNPSSYGSHLHLTHLDLGSASY